MNISDQITVFIEVIDVNDNPPLFMLTSYAVAIEEFTPAYTSVVRVMAVDSDSVSNITYTLGGEVNESFYIDPDRGVIFVSEEPLTARNYHLFVIASDGEHNSQADVFISVSRSDLSFMKELYIFQIFEQITAGSLVGRVEAITLGNVSALEYSNFQFRVGMPDPIGFSVTVSNEQTNATFSINGSTGDISTLTEFGYDAESRQAYFFTVEVYDIIGGTVFDRTTIIIKVLDENDNPPIFSQPFYYQTIEDSLSHGAFVVNVSASDNDSGTNGEIFFILDPDMDGFLINRVNGEISVSNTTLYVGQYNLTVVAIDYGAAPLNSTAGVFITVVHPGEEDIEFIESVYTFYIVEDAEAGTTVGRVQVRNETYDNIEYSSSNLFGCLSLNQSSGEIQVICNLDREAQSEYELYVYAHYHGLNGHCMVVIYVMDVNDNAPRFTLETYAEIVNVNFGSSIAILQVMATDDDLGNNSTIVYSFTEDTTASMYFRTNSSTGEIFLRGTGIPVGDHALMVQASDLGTPFSMKSVAVVVIRLHFSVDFFNTSVLMIEENQEPETIVGTIVLLTPEGTVHPDDYHDNLQFSIVRSEMHLEPGNCSQDYNCLFSIDPRNGTIYVLTVLDREAADTHMIVVLANFTQFGISIETSLKIVVVDRNDVHPQFEPTTYTAHINDSTEIGTAFITVHTVDYDNESNAEVWFQLDPQSATPFDIRVRSYKYPHTYGEIYLKNTTILTEREYTFRILASNLGIPLLQSIAEAHVRVDYILPDMISFQSEIYEFTVTEHTARDVIVGHVSIEQMTPALDGLVYRIVMGSEHFWINAITGVIAVNRDIDREIVPQLNLTIMAILLTEPSLGSAESVVVVTVEDINDNPPIFNEQMYLKALLTTEISVNESLLQVTASDADSGLNALITYSLDVAAHQYFYITNDGLIFTETIDLSPSTYQLVVTAHDMGTPSRTSQASVTILIQRPVPDHLQFTQPEGYTFNISENNPIGWILGQVSLHSIPEFVEEYISYASSDDNFSINETTGEVKTLTSFDYEEEQSYDFQIIARMNIATRVPPVDIQASVNITVVIIDLNDNAPVFSDFPSILTHLENRTSEELLHHILATDADSGINQQLEFSVFGFDVHDKFHINSSTGELYIAASLDREEQENFMVTVCVRDLGIPQHNVTQTVMITLTDINDNAPILSLDNYEARFGNHSVITVNDAADIGTVVTNVSAVDIDFGNNAEVNFEAAPMTTPFRTRLRDYDYPFTFGELLLTNSSPLVVGLYNVTIYAFDRGQNQLQSSVSIAIKVVPAVISFPETLYEFVLSEHSPVNITIGNVSVEQISPAPDGFVYNITRGNEDGFFELDHLTGVITAVRTIDRETDPQFNLTITAELPTEPNLEHAATTVIINIRDINDNIPVFSESSYMRVLLTTDVPTSMKLLQVFVFDMDLGSNADLSLSLDIVSPHVDDNPFYITQDGNVFTNASFLNASTYQLNVTAEDMGQHPLTSSVPVIIIVQHPVPSSIEFTQPYGYVFTTNENSASGAIIGNVQTEPYSQYIEQHIRFWSDNVNFSVVPTTGDILALNTFDYEEEQRYVFLVSAQLMITSRIPPVNSESFINVTVEIMDVNDNYPEFTNLPMNLSIIENRTLQEPVYCVLATDADSGTNQQLEFRILNVDLHDRFHINSSTGELFATMKLDREERDNYTIIILVQDLGTPRMLMESTLTVMLTDINDNAPTLSVYVDDQEINGDVYITIDDSTESGEIIANLNAFDQDIGSNAEVDFEIDSNVPFMVQVSGKENTYTSGVISVANSTLLTVGTYTFHIVATDKGEPLLSTAVLVTVTVKHALPEFISFPLEGYEFTVAENSSRNTFVGNVSVEQVTPALDGLVYSIVEGNEEEFFAINESNGIITTEQILDKETHSQFNVTIAAFLPLEPSLDQVNISVLVHVQDINDNAPKFSEQSYFLAILTSEALINVSLLQTAAFDLDSGSNARLLYTVELMTPHIYFNPFFIASDGHIFATTTLNATTYHLNVSAQDMGTPRLESFVSVSILVQLPVPEHLQFTHPEGYMFNISENSPSGSIIGQVSLELIPSYVQEYITFSGFTTNFIINEATGEVQTLRPSDYEEKQVYEFEATARMVITSRIPPVDIQTFVNITVAIEDINDCAPVFDDLPSNLSFPENRTTEELLYRIAATDCDSGINQQLEYHILNKDLIGKFYINSSTGELYTAASVDREDQQIYAIVIQVNDLGTPRMSATETITITLTDVNDNSPDLSLDCMHSSPSHSLVILTSDILTNMSLCQVLVTDADSGSNAQVVYTVELLSPQVYPQPFTITDDGGIFTTTTDLNATTYHLNVTSQDMGIPSLASYIHVSILVQLPVPEYIQFTQPEEYIFNITENTPSGFTVGQVTLEPVPQYVEEYISFTSGNSNFYVNRTTGEIETLNSFDYEEQQRYTFEVQARMLITARVPPVDIQTLVNITVYVTDANDNSPTFVSLPSYLSILENRTFEEFLYHIVANDTDSGINQQLEFTILNQDVLDKFYIYSSTGELYAATGLDREDQANYSIVIRVSDLGTPSLSVEGTVTVVLEDINDNVPILTIQVNGIDVGNGTTVVIDDDTEPGEIIANLTAVDHDIGINAHVYFEIDSDDILPLSVHVSGSEQSHTFGEVVVSNTSLLIADIYTVTIHAIDFGKSTLRTSNTVLITVKHALPDIVYFNQTTYEFSFNEHSPRGTVIGNVSIEQMSPALDSLQYTIIGGSGEDVFRIDPTSGCITVELDVDREMNTHFNLTIRALLPTEPSLQPAESTVILTVLDINDNVPTFIQRDYSIYFPITEISTNNSLTQVVAVDNDLGSNAQVSYSIHVMSPPAQLNNFYITESGRIFTTTTNLYVPATYIFNVTARDMGVPGQSTTQLVTLTIQIPVPISIQFTQPEGYEFTINENAHSGRIIGQVAIELTQILRQANTYIRYFDNEVNFGVDSLSGAIRTFNTFDYENTQNYTFEVSARLYIPTNIPPIDVQTSINVTVLITDENDNTPVFVHFPSNLTQLENQTFSEFLYHINATDADSGANQLLQYEILNRDLHDKFSINSSTGELYSVASLDREVQEVYLIAIQVSDSGTPRRSTQGTVTLRLLDVNDNVPRLVDGFEISVYERTPPQSLLQLRAVDLDLHQNGMVQFYKVQTTVNGTQERVDTSLETRVITVSQVGNLHLYRELDFEVAQWYNIHIRVVDLGNPPLQFVYTNITLHVIDVQDTPPQFERDGIYHISILPRLSTGETIVQVHATDADPGDAISYAIESIHHEVSDMNVNFSINAISGRIYSPIDQFLSPEDNITINLLAYDNSKFRLIARATTNIIVLPERLQFSQSSYTVEVREDAPPNTEIIRISLQHLSFSSHVRYSIDVIEPVVQRTTFTFSGNGEPQVSILLNSELDREAHEEYFIRVTAERANNTAQTTLLINVIDVNDNAPHFVDQHFEFRISEATTVGTVVHRVNVSDADIGNNSILLFEIGMDSFSPLPFTVDPYTGYITVEQSLDYEAVTTYVITVTVSDHGLPPLQTSQNYTINITNENDNYPQFSAPAYFGEVYARARRYEYVHHTLLHATDRDDIANEQRLTFAVFHPISLRSKVLSQYMFEVSPQPPYSVQVISLPEEADVESRLLELRVQVTDEGGLSSYVPLYISIFTTDNLITFELSGVRRGTLMSCVKQTTSICGFRNALENAAEITLSRPVSFYNNSIQVSETDSTM